MNGSPVVSALDALTGALFLLTAIGVVATRQVLASLQLFILQSLLLTLSAVLLGIAQGSVHLFAVAAITIATKTLLIPWLLRHTVSAAVYRTREIERVLNIPSSLLIAAVLIVLAYVVANPLFGFGLLSVAIATRLFIHVRDFKRMFAFATVEHMGLS
jgi:hydrogenase-4 component E